MVLVPPTRGPGPLDGIRVLDLSRVLAGPHCTRALVDLGAEVIKLEPPEGDLTRFAYPRVNSLATYFVQQNVGKRNVSLDLQQPEAVELVAQLAERCDVLVENFRAGIMDKLGLGYAALAARNPRLVYCSITGYGSTGPWTTRRAYAATVQGEAGLTLAQAAAWGREPVNDAHSHGDVYTALEATIAICAALVQRDRTGRGQHLDVAMAQSLLYVNEHVHDHLWDREVPDGVIRSFRPGTYPALRLADGSFAIAAGHVAEKGTFDRWVAAMGRPELLTDPRFATLADRLHHLAELVDEIRAWAATVPDVEAFEAIVSRHQIAAGRLRTVREVAGTEWAAEREVIVEVSDRGEGTIRIPNAPWRFSEAEVGARGEPRYRGEDNREVFGSLLGLSDGELDRLAADGVFSARGPAA
jgi:crotonobetainyl-CoA:carnitine CoA-transferase CaiB-like acyl-CoA transferase